MALLLAVGAATAGCQPTSESASSSPSPLAVTGAHSPRAADRARESSTDGKREESPGTSAARDSAIAPPPPATSQRAAAAADEIISRDPPRAGSFNGATEQTPAADEKVRARSMRRAGGVLDLTFDDLEFGIQVDEDFRDEMLTDEIRALHGQTVILRGFILASSVFQQRGIKQFVLIRDNQECCFGPGAKIYHNVMVDMVGGATANFSFRPVTAHGTFSIQPWINPGDGKCYSVFHLAATRVE